MPRALAFILLLLALGSPCLAAEAAAPRFRIRLRAETTDYDLRRERAVARDGAELSYRDLTLRADAIEADLGSGQVQAYGGVSLTQEQGRLTAESARYNLRTRSGVLTRAEAVFGPARFTGERLVVSPDRMMVQAATFTTCDRPRPDYLLRAASITYYPGDRLAARRATLYLYGHRLITVPSYSLSLRREEVAPGPAPRVGWSRADGPFAGLVYGFSPGGAREFTAALDARYTQQRGVRSLLQGHYLPSWGRVTLTASRKEDLSERPIAFGFEPLPVRVREVTVDRLPELAVRTRSRKLLPGLEGQFWAGVGHYREQPSGVTGGRTGVMADLRTARRPVSRALGLEPGVGWRYATYSGGEHQQVVAPRLGIRYQPKPELDLALTYQHRTPSGRTPFTFDEVEITREVTGELTAVPHRGWRTELRARYDAEGGELRDAGVTLVRVLHCLEYSVGWRTAGGEVRLGVNLAGEAAQLVR